ncbi:MAG: response regulator transcription factor [Deltaproteobacteria bacterium]|nr:response regulator transcription factor [Deltaproteobacteria bacterium]
MSDRILIIEDEADLVATLTYNLGREGFQVTSAMTGQDALQLAHAGQPPDIVLLDLMLPDMPGTEVCRRLRADAHTRHVPIIMVTAKSDEIDRVVGFEVGADDYVTKPFSVRELLLRIRAVLRRARSGDAAPAPSPAAPGDSLEVGKIKLDVAGHRAWVEGEQVRLTALEFKLLQTFIERQGRVQTRDHLLNDVWGIEADITTRTVDTHVKRLRDKLGRAGVYIETIRGVGYRFQIEPEDPS